MLPGENQKPSRRWVARRGDEVGKVARYSRNEHTPQRFSG